MRLKTNILRLEQQAKNLDIEILTITMHAIHQMTLMSSHHKDPFDRIIAATALTMGKTLLSADAVFDSYRVSRLWE